MHSRLANNSKLWTRVDKHGTTEYQNTQHIQREANWHRKTVPLKLKRSSCIHYPGKAYHEKLDASRCMDYNNKVKVAIRGLQTQTRHI
uniref:Uncharacterized protein n=1 Tax=Arundo donax TaxID=35708 RepID=A0A0A9EMH7_ARUDO